MSLKETCVCSCALAVGLAAGGFGTRWAVDWARSPSAATATAAASDSAPLHPDPVEWDAMVGKLQRLAAGYPGRAAIYLKDLKGGRTWTFHADDLFLSASLIKLPVMACVFKRISEGKLALDTKLRLHRRDRMGGSGRLKWARDGAEYTVREVLSRMIHESDNTAMRMLLDEIGLDYFRREFPSLGLNFTQIHPEGLSLVSGPVRNDNYTTAREMAFLLEKIYRGEMVDKVSSELMFETLKGVKSHKRLAKPLPVGWALAHKTGLLRRACHDVGIVMTPHGDYILAVLTGQNNSYAGAKGFIEHLALTSYEHLKTDSAVAKAAPPAPAARTR